MVDAEDLKSFGHCDRVGSSPTIPTTNFGYRAQQCAKRRTSSCFFGCVAQLVRALRSHRRGRWFESNHIHHKSVFIHSKYACVAFIKFARIFNRDEENSNFWRISGRFGLRVRV